MLALAWLSSPTTQAHDIRLAGPSPGSVDGASVHAFPDGRILVVNGEARLWDPKLRAWVSQGVGQPQPRRFWHSATALGTNRIVLIGGLESSGGYDRPENALASVAIWDAELGAWTLGPSLLTPRVAHGAALLPSGEILVTGGSSMAHRARAYGALLSSTELVSDKTTTSRAALSVARAYHSANTLSDGRVIVIGGVDDDGHPLASVEIYDLRSDRWEAGPALRFARTEHTATVLGDGSVLVVGGFDAAGEPIATAEVLRAGANAWQGAGQLSAARGRHQATQLDNGDLLISGGQRLQSASHAGTPVLSLELRRAASGEWQPAGELPLMFRDHRAALVRDGAVLLFGADPYGSATLAWVPDAPESIAVSATGNAALTQLADGRFLLTGGQRRQEPTAAALIYDPASHRWTSTRPMHWPRSGHRAVRLRDGRVLVLGGSIAGVKESDVRSAEPPSFPAEIWNPATGRWSFSTSLEYANGSWAEPALLADGRVMLGATVNQDAYSSTLHYFRIWDPSDDSVTALAQVPRTRVSGQAIYYSDGHLLYLGGEDREAERIEPSDLDGRRLDWWDPATQSWKALRPAELSLSGMELHALSDGGVFAWKRPRQGQSDESSRVVLAWQPLWGWRTLPAPADLDAGAFFEPIALGQGDLLIRLSERSWLWSATRSQWEPIAHEARWGSVLGTFTSADGKLISFRTRQESEAGFAPVEAVWLNRAAARWEPLQRGYIARHAPAMITLKDGRVMVAGGEVALAQIWNPRDDSWSHTGYTSTVLRWPTGLLLADGRVMLAGVLAGHEETLVCELWDPHSQSWQSCGRFPTDQRLSRRAPVLRYLDDEQVLLVHGEQRALLWKGEQWIATRLQLPKNSGVPMPSAAGSPYLNPLASVWNPAQNRWDDATDVLFWYGLGWHGYRTANGDVLATSGAVSLFEWSAAAKTLSQINLRSDVYGTGLNALSATTDGCMLAWTNSLDTDRRQLPMAMLGNRETARWDLTRLAIELPYDARAAILDDGTMLIAGQPRSQGSGALRVRAGCAGVEVLDDVDESYLPIADPNDAGQTLAPGSSAPLASAPRPKLRLGESWVETWKGHWRALREHVKSKIALGLLLVFLVVRFVVNRWGEYHSDENGIVLARRIDIATLCLTIPVTLLAMGLANRGLQFGIAGVASILAAIAAWRLWINSGEPRHKAASAPAFVIAGAMAVWVVGSHVADALYRGIRFLTDFS